MMPQSQALESSWIVRPLYARMDATRMVRSATNVINLYAMRLCPLPCVVYVMSMDNSIFTIDKPKFDVIDKKKV